MSGGYTENYSDLPNPDRILWEHDRNSVDEFVAHNVTVHLEQMSDDCYWMRVSRGDQAFAVNVYRERKRDPLRCTVEDEDHRYPWVWARDEEHPA